MSAALMIQWSAADWLLFDSLKDRSIPHIAYAMNKPLAEVEAVYRDLAAPDELAPEPIPVATKKEHAPDKKKPGSRGGFPDSPTLTRRPSRPEVRDEIHEAFRPYIGVYNSVAMCRPLPR